MSKRVRLIVYIDLDPVAGTMHTDKSAQNIIQAILDMRLPHYNPNVSIDDEKKATDQ
jgi:hypothetical protein